MESTSALIAADPDRAKVDQRPGGEHRRERREGAGVAAGAADPAARKPMAFIPRAVLAVLAPVLAVNLAGLPYYLLPQAERIWHPLHPWFRPAGYVGQSAGLLALGMFLFLWLYPVRKRFRWLAFTGPLSKWLDVHIIAGASVPFIAATHASWRFTGLIGLGYGAMLLVAVSGLIGRYLYVRIPRTRDGLAMGREEIAAQRRELVGSLVAATGLSSDRILKLLEPTPMAKGGLPAAVATMIRDDLARSRATRGLLRDWKRAAVGNPPSRKELRRIAALARREMAISQQMRLLDVTNRIFRHWHLAHQPFAITAFVAVIVHVAVAIAFGATWIG